MLERATWEITQRELLNEFAAIMRGVERGESFTITRNGTPIGRLIPLRRRTFVPREEAIAAFATAPMLDPDQFHRDLDAIAGQDPVQPCLVKGVSQSLARSRGHRNLPGFMSFLLNQPTARKASLV